MAKLLFVAGSLALLPATIAFDLTEPSFDRWRARYGIPEYNSREARARALRTWRDNLRRVEQHNSNPSKFVEEFYLNWRSGGVHVCK